MLLYNKSVTPSQSLLFIYIYFFLNSVSVFFSLFNWHFSLHFSTKWPSQDARTHYYFSLRSSSPCHLFVLCPLKYQIFLIPIPHLVLNLLSVDMFLITLHIHDPVHYFHTLFSQSLQLQPLKCRYHPRRLWHCIPQNCKLTRISLRRPQVFCVVMLCHQATGL